MPSRINDGLCADCQVEAPAAMIRNRALCSACVLRYVRSKVLKRLESYRFKQTNDESRRKVLLPLSGGLSSLVLLHVLDDQLRRQRETRNWTSYDLCVIHVGAEEVVTTTRPAWYENAKRRYTEHELIDVVSLSDICKLDRSFEKDIQCLDLHRRSAEPDDTFVERVLGSPRTITARTDMLDLIVRRLVMQMARLKSIESILWGHSNSRLAAEALAGVAKGRGVAIRSNTTDDHIQDGLAFHYPLRDLSKSELGLYTELQPEELAALRNFEDLSEQPRRNVRDMSIDELLTSYVTEQGLKYPNIAANVVRTVGKLQSIVPTKTSRICPLCRTLYDEDVSGACVKKTLCYGCSRLRQDILPLASG